MPTPISPAARTLGVRSAVLATIFSLAYVIAQLAEWAGLLGSQGGPSSGSTPLGLALLLTPSLLLGSTFVVLMVCVHEWAAPARRVWSRAAVAFATMYAVLISLVYFVQLTLVAPRLASGRMADIELLRFVPFDSFLYSVDLLGYSFMSLATLLAAPVLTGGGRERAARWFLAANGLLLPFLVGQLYVPELIWGGALWGITFPGAAWTLALLFRGADVAADGAPRVAPALAAPTAPTIPFAAPASRSDAVPAATGAPPAP